MGVATIIPRQKLIHPKAGSYEGTDVDYWMNPGLSVSMHEEVGSAVLSEAVRVESIPVERLDASKMKRARHLFMATTQPGALYNRGLHAYMAPIDDPAVLRTSPPDDRYGIAKDGQQLQLYVATHEPFTD